MFVCNVYFSLTTRLAWKKLYVKSLILSEYLPVGEGERDGGGGGGGEGQGVVLFYFQLWVFCEIIFQMHIFQPFSAETCTKSSIQSFCLCGR